MEINPESLVKFTTSTFKVKPRYLLLEVYPATPEPILIPRGTFVWSSDARAIARFLRIANENLDLIIVNRSGEILSRWNRETPEPPIVVDDSAFELDPYDGVPADTKTGSQIR